MTSRLNPGTIRRVLPVMKARETGAGRVMCLSAELYDGWTYVDFWVTPRPGAQQPTFPMLGVTAVDDVGTSYRSRSGGGTGIGPDNRWRSSYVIEPAPPENAAQLELSVRLGRLPEQPTASSGWIEFDDDSEPVTFRISLA